MSNNNREQIQHFCPPNFCLALFIALNPFLPIPPGVGLCLFGCQSVSANVTNHPAYTHSRRLKGKESIALGYFCSVLGLILRKKVGWCKTAVNKNKCPFKSRVKYKNKWLKTNIILISLLILRSLE